MRGDDRLCVPQQLRAEGDEFLRGSALVWGAVVCSMKMSTWCERAKLLRNSYIFGQPDAPVGEASPLCQSACLVRIP
eukprot:3650132-Pyramimonas_sp.AAC.1